MMWYSKYVNSLNHKHWTEKKGLISGYSSSWNQTIEHTEYTGPLTVILWLFIVRPGRDRCGKWWHVTDTSLLFPGKSKTWEGKVWDTRVLRETFIGVQKWVFDITVEGVKVGVSRLTRWLHVCKSFLIHQVHSYRLPFDMSRTCTSDLTSFWTYILESVMSYLHPPSLRYLTSVKRGTVV